MTKKEPGILLRRAPEEPERADSWLQIRISEESFALPVSRVQEIVRVIGISKTEGAPFPVSGSVRLRNRSIPVVDLRLRMGMGKADPVDSRLVVLRSRERTFGALVDSVDGLISVDPETVEPLPADARSRHSDYIVGVRRDGEEMTLLLDVDRTLGAEA